jgi:hypothetical protein
VIVVGVTGPMIFVSLTTALVIAAGVVFNCCGCEMMNEVVFGAVEFADTVTVGRESLSMTGGMVDVRFFLSCSMTSATFEELASFVTGITDSSLGGVSAAFVRRPRP